MPLFICRQGHQWQPEANGPSATAQRIACPQCGAAAEPVRPGGPPPLPAAAVPTASYHAQPPTPAPLAEAQTVPPRRPPPQTIDLPTVPPDAKPPAFEGADVPGYEILGVLGRGGMGVVYKARQISLKRLVALKMILAGSHAGPADLARFRVEAEAVARLQHPNIVQIYEVGEAGGLPYFSLEYVNGGSLAKELAGAPLRARQAAELVDTLARAVHHAHRREIVHRDLKPANVLLTRGGEPKITDFGLAKQLEAEGDHLTRSGAIMGTPSYMAPEQAEGKTKRIGPATDIYALGAILYECLTGRPPFKAQTPLDTILQVVSEEPVPPRILQRKVPRDLETICLKCLEKKAEQRYASARALADDLRRFLDGEPIHARHLGHLGRAWRWMKTHPGYAVMALVLLVAGGVGILDMIQRVNAIPDFPVFPDKNNPFLAKGRPAVPPRVAPDPIPSLARAVQTGRRVRAVAFSPDGLLLATAGDDRVVTLWDPATGKKAGTLRGHADAISSVAFRPDGKQLAAAGWDGTVRLWDMPGGRLLRTFANHGRRVWAVAFSPDGKYLALGGSGPTVHVREADTGRQIHALTGHTDHVSCVAFSPDGKHLATGSWDRTVRVWDAAGGNAICTFSGHKSRICHVAFRPDGERLASADEGTRILLWDPRTGQDVRPLRTSSGPLSSLAFRRDGKQLAVAGWDRSARLCDTDTGRALFQPLGHAHFITALAFDPEGGRLAAAGRDGTVQLWKIPAAGPGNQNARAKP
jgi:WD40 repeat protein